MFFFKENKDRSDLRAFVRRVTDLTSPNLPPLKGELRTLTRSNRTFPVLLTPWIRGAPNMEACVAALTKNFSDEGLALVLQQPFHAEEVVIGIWLECQSRFGLGRNPHFAMGAIRQSVSLGGGFWQVGIQLKRLVTTQDEPTLNSLLPRLAHLVPEE